MTLQEKLAAARTIANGTAKKQVSEPLTPQIKESMPGVDAMDVRSKLNAAREIARGTVQRGSSPTSTKTTPSVLDSPLLLPAKAALAGLTLSQKPMLDTAKLAQKPINAVVESVRRHEAEKREKMEGYLALDAAARELGRFGAGNIDLYNRPQFPNEDGTISTVRSITINEDGKEIVIPTITFGEYGAPHRMSDQGAIDHYHRTGEYLGKFDTREEAEAYAQKLHQAQEFYYGSRPNKELMTKGEQKLDVWATLRDSLLDEMAPPVYKDSGWKDPFYAWVNGSTDAGAYLKLQDNTFGGGGDALGHVVDGVVGGNQEAAEMTPEEIATYNYIYATESPGEARKFYEYIKSDLYRRQRKTEEEMWAKRADKDPAGTSIFSTLMSPAKVISYAMQLGDYLGDGKIDQNAPYNSFVYVPAAIRSEVAKNTEKYWVDRGHEFAGKSASFLYQTGMSMADFVFNTAVSGGNPKVALAIMGTGAAADATIEAKDRGLSDDQAFALGTIAGIAEIVTERFSLEALLKGKWEKGAIQYILKNAITEGSEEFGSDAINLFADILISKDQSKWAQAIAFYKGKGKSDIEAFWRAVGDQALSMGLDFLGGALSGGTLAGGNVAVNTVINQKVGRNFRQSMNDADGLYQAAIDKGLESDPDTNAHYLAQRYQKVLDKKGSLSDGKLGGLYRAIIADIEAKKRAGRTVDTTATQNPAEGVKRAPVEGTEIPSTSIDTDPATHTPEQQAAIEAYQADADETLRDVFQGYLDNPNQGFSRHNISSVSQRQAQDAQRLLGGDYAGYRNAINSNGIQHILGEHGPSGTVDHSLADLNDIARMGHVLDNHDNVELVTYESGDADHSREFRDKNDRPAPMLKFSKRVDGTYYVVEAIPESKHKKFWVVSAYMEKADGGTQAPDANGPRTTPNASLASSPSASTDIISQPPGGVNLQRALPGDIPADIPPGLRKLYRLAQEMSTKPQPREIPRRPVQQSPQEILSQLAQGMAMGPQAREIPQRPVQGSGWDALHRLTQEMAQDPTQDPDVGMGTPFQSAEQYSRWLQDINAQTTTLDTVDKYREAEYNNSPEYQLLRGYAKAVEQGDISPLIGFDQFAEVDKEATRSIVGKATSTGVVIESAAPHCIARIIGQVSTPHSGMRQGISIEAVLDALQNPVKIGEIKICSDGDIRQTFQGKKAVVTISLRDKRLIQTNPTR